jgi:uncharacterized protein YbgA (DUF1722 family)
MTKWAEDKLKKLEKTDLCGFIFKTRSPSSGMQGVKIYNEKGMPLNQKGIGVFAKAFMEHFPLLPVEDEGRLHDDAIRENFIERVFVYKRWMDLVEQDLSIKKIVGFHAAHKYLIMAHSPERLRRLGEIVADAKNYNFDVLKKTYKHELFDVLKIKSSMKKNVNVLYHMTGYFKKKLSLDEKKEIVEIIEQYHKKYLPLIVPITIIKHYTMKYNEEYLKNQVYLNPHPVELMLRNHV